MLFVPPSDRLITDLGIELVKQVVVGPASAQLKRNCFLDFLGRARLLRLLHFRLRRRRSDFSDRSGCLSTNGRLTESSSRRREALERLTIHENERPFAVASSTDVRALELHLSVSGDSQRSGALGEAIANPVQLRSDSREAVSLVLVKMNALLMPRSEKVSARNASV